MGLDHTEQMVSSPETTLCLACKIPYSWVLDFDCDVSSVFISLLMRALCRQDSKAFLTAASRQVIPSRPGSELLDRISIR